MNKDADKTKDELLAELVELRKKYKGQEAKLKLKDKELDAKVLRRTKEVKQSEQHYQMLFDESPVPTWDEDFSECKNYIDSLKKRKITNFREYFAKNPDDIIELSKKVKIININKAVVKLHEAPSKKDILHSLASIFVDKSYETFTEQLICIAHGKKEYKSEAIVKTIAGVEKNILLSWAVVPGYEDTLEKVYVTTTDITEHKQAEQQLRASNQQLEANNQQLQATEQQLRAANQQLIASERAIRESEEKFRKAFTTSPDSININRLDDGMYVSINNGYTEITGYTESDVVGKTSLEINIWENSSDRKKLVDGLRKQGQVQNLEAQFRMKDGKLVYGLMSATIISLGGVPHIISISRNITARKKAEKELIKLSTAVTQSPSIIIITDTNGKLEYVNPKFTKITGYTQGEVIGQNPNILQSKEHTDEMYKELWETISSGKTWKGEFHNKKKNGELYWEMAFVSPIFDEQGNIINYIKDSEDISERKRMEDNFKHSIEESPLGIRIVNQKGDTIYINKALLAIYEYSTFDEFVNTESIKRYTKESYKEHKERKKIRLAGGDVSDYEISIRRKDGEVRHIKVWRKEVLWNREKHFQVINQDITELKQLHTDLVTAKEKAEESDRLKSAFLANMSHEIRTPMNGILGFTNLLKKPQLTGDKKEKYIKIIERSGKRMLDTINDIIDISKIEAKQVEVANSAVSVNSLLDELFNFFQREATAKGLNLYYKPSLTDKESLIITDPHKLEGILTNLLKNAIKYTLEGEIIFGCNLSYKADLKFIEFYVKDTGIGVPADRLEAIFNRFEQADIEDKGVFEGSGLGLTISKSYAEMLGGKIGVKSREGQGSTFTLSIPYMNTSIKKIREKSASKFFNKLSIIVAEDDENSRIFIKTILENETKHLILTSTGKEAVEKIRENPNTDVILMDIKMPEMNGYEATREIRKFNKNVIIIAQTAYALSSDKEKALEAGCNDYITKPIEEKILFEKIRTCLDKKNI